jgi:hypothetical protein
MDDDTVIRFFHFVYKFCIWLVVILVIKARRRYKYRYRTCMIV